jgi:cell division protein FtsB
MGVLMSTKKPSSMSFRNKLLLAVFVFLFLVLVLASFFGKKGLLEVYSAQKEKTMLLEEIDRLEQAKSELEREIRELETNPKAYEAKAREKLGLVYPDELLIIKPGRENTETRPKKTSKK